MKELEGRAANRARLEAHYGNRKAVAQSQIDEVAAPGLIQLPAAHLSWRHELLERGLRAGVSISQLAALKSLFHDPLHGFGGEREETYRQLIPALRDTERAKVLKFLASKWWSFEFDGTPHCGDLLGIVLRFFDDEGNQIHQTLLRVGHLTKSPDAEVLAWKLTDMLKKFDSDVSSTYFC